MPKCEAQTRKKRPCPNGASVQHTDGRWLCHIHHPMMIFRQQVDRRQSLKAELKATGQWQKWPYES